MLENITLSISTMLFLLCSLVLGSIAPSDSSESATVESVLSETVDSPVACSAETASAGEDFTVVGIWQCFGSTYEFTSSGKLITDRQVMLYSVDGGYITVKDGKQTYTFSYEPLDSRVMRFNGATMYRIDDVSH